MDKFPKNFSTGFINILNENICDQINPSLNQYLAAINTNCENFVYNSTSFGLNVIMTNFIEEIRQMKFKNELLLQKKADTFNSLSKILEIYFSNEPQKLYVSYKLLLFELILIKPFLLINLSFF